MSKLLVETGSRHNKTLFENSFVGFPVQIETLSDPVSILRDFQELFRHQFH